MTHYRPVMPRADYATWGFNDLDAQTEEETAALGRAIAERAQEDWLHEQEIAQERAAFAAYAERQAALQQQAYRPTAADVEAETSAQTFTRPALSSGPEVAPPPSPASPLFETALPSDEDLAKQIAQELMGTQAHAGPGGWGLGGSPRDMASAPETPLPRSVTPEQQVVAERQARAVRQEYRPDLGPAGPFATVGEAFQGPLAGPGMGIARGISAAEQYAAEASAANIPQLQDEMRAALLRGDEQQAQELEQQINEWVAGHPAQVAHERNPANWAYEIGGGLAQGALATAIAPSAAAGLTRNVASAIVDPMNPLGNAAISAAGQVASAAGRGLGAAARGVGGALEREGPATFGEIGRAMEPQGFRAGPPFPDLPHPDYFQVVKREQGGWTIQRRRGPSIPETEYPQVNQDIREYVAAHGGEQADTGRRTGQWGYLPEGPGMPNLGEALAIGRVAEPPPPMARPNVWDPMADVAQATPGGKTALHNLNAMFDRVQAGPQRTMRSRWEQTSQWLEERIADQNAPLTRLGPTAERETGLYAARGAVASQRVEEGLLPVVEAAQGAERELNVFIQLQRDLEVATQPRFAGRDRLFGGGLHNETEIREALSQLHDDVGEETWVRLVQADGLRQIGANKLLDDKVAIGLVPLELADWLKTMHPHYNPTRVDEAAADFAGMHAQGQRGAALQSSNTIRRLSEFGHTEDTVLPLASYAEALRSGELAIQRNRLAQAILVDAFRSGVAEAVPNVKLTRGALTEPIEAATGETVRQARVASHFAPWEAPPGHISVMLHGERQLFKVPENVAEAATRLGEGLDPIGQGIGTKVLRAMAALNEPARAAFTSMSPQFLPVNMMADLITTFIREGARTTARIPAGWYHAALKDDVYRQLLGEGGLSGGLWGKSDEEVVRELIRGSGADLARRVQQEGGRLIKSPGELMRLFTPKELAREFGLDVIAGGVGGGISAASAPEDQRLQEGLKGAAIYAGARRPLRRIQEIAEQAPRIATFQGRLAKGELPREAALAARRVTVDFSRGGDAIKALNNVSLFLNAGTQGLLQLPRTLRDEPAARLRMAGLAAAATTAYLYNRQFPEYRDVPDWEKIQGQVLMLPGSEPNPDGVGYKRLNHVLMPMREWALFTAPLTYMFEALEGKTPDSWVKFALEAVQSYAPGVPKGEIPYLGLQAVRGPIEVATNTNLLTGNPIESRAMESLPQSERYNERTSGFAMSPAGKEIGKAFRLSPKKLDHLVKSEAGTLGNVMLEGSNVTAGREVVGVPLLSGLLRGVWRTYGGAIRDRQYGRYDDAYRAVEPQLTTELKATPDFQAATPDMQARMLAGEKRVLEEALKIEYGIAPRERDIGAPQKYHDISDPREETARDQELTEARRQGNKVLVAALERRITSAWHAWTKEQEKESGARGEQVRRRVQELVGAGR